MDKKPQTVHAHPISILRYLWRFLFLLIIPVVRGFFSALRGGFIAWVSGTWLDILIVLLIIVLAVEKWRRFKYYFDINGIYYTSGILFRRESRIPMVRICALSLLKAVWLRPFGIVKVRVDTLALGVDKADLEFYVRTQEGERILALRRQDAAVQDGVAAEYHPNPLSIVFQSLFTSNSFLGILFLSTFISQAGKILGRELSDLLLTTFEEFTRQVAFGLPPVLAGVAIALIAGWLVAFVWNLLQAKNLYTIRTADTLRLGGGVVVERAVSLRLADISFVDIRQSLITRLLGLYSVFISAIGLGKDKSEIAALVPFSTRSRAFHQLSLLLPGCQPSKRALKPNAGAVFKFIILPLWACVLVPAGALLAGWLLPRWLPIIRFTGFMSEVPALWFLGVRLVDFFTSGASKVENYYTLRYSSGYYLHTVVFPADKIVLVNLRQSIFQRKSRKCDLLVSTRAEGRARHHLRNLGWDDCAALFDLAH